MNAGRPAFARTAEVTPGRDRSLTLHKLAHSMLHLAGANRWMRFQAWVVQPVNPLCVTESWGNPPGAWAIWPGPGDFSHGLMLRRPSFWEGTGEECFVDDT